MELSSAINQQYAEESELEEEQNDDFFENNSGEGAY